MFRVVIKKFKTFKQRITLAKGSNCPSLWNQYYRLMYAIILLEITRVQGFKVKSDSQFIGSYNREAIAEYLRHDTKTHSIEKDLVTGKYYRKVRHVLLLKEKQIGFRTCLAYNSRSEYT